MNEGGKIEKKVRSRGRKMENRVEKKVDVR